MKKSFKRLLGVLLILVAIVGGFYVGGWLFFFKAIMDIIEAIKAGWIVMDIVKGLCKIFIGIPAVGTMATIIVAIGVCMCVDD